MARATTTPKVRAAIQTSDEVGVVLAERFGVQAMKDWYNLKPELFRKQLVVEQDISVQRGFQIFSGMEVVRLQHLLDPAVEAFDHAVGLGVLWRSQAVFDMQVGAELIERVRAGRSALAQAEQAVGELFSIACWE